MRHAITSMRGFLRQVCRNTLCLASTEQPHSRFPTWHSPCTARSTHSCGPLTREALQEISRKGKTMAQRKNGKRNNERTGCEFYVAQKFLALAKV